MDNYTNQDRTPSPVVRLQLPLLDRSVTTEISEDYSLPDYQPEIKRLLRVSATVQPANRYVGGGAAEFSGTVDYCILYAGNDGQLYCFPQSADYSFRVPLTAGPEFDLNDGLVVYALCEPESVISRVSGPRRMSIKCRIGAKVRAYASCVREEKRQGGAAPGEERLFREAESGVVSWGISEPQTVTDEVILEQEGGEWRVISGESAVMMQDAVAGNGRVSCRGEVMLRLLLQKEGEGQAPVVMTRKIPFGGEVPVDGASVNGEAVATGYCTSLNLNMEEGRVLCDAEIVMEARSQRRETVSYTGDWYSIGTESSCEMSECTLPVAIRCLNGNISLSESRSLEETGIAPAARVIDVTGTAVVDGWETDRDRMVLTGRCRYTLILSQEGELSAKEVEMPFRYLAEGIRGEEKPCAEAQVQILTARARMDGERLAIDSELAVALRLWKEQEIRMVSQVNVGETVERPAGQTLLCYPAPGETLWAVAKRYHAGLDALSDHNQVNTQCRADDPASLEGVRLLVI